MQEHEDELEEGMQEQEDIVDDENIEEYMYAP